MPYQRRLSSVAHVGNIAIGGSNPIRVQSMTTTDTNDTEGSVAQAKRIIDAGGELVRLTTQGTREAENMKHIAARLHADGYLTPLVADVHFNAHVADVAALYCEKVRINPGNYVDPARTFKQLEYTDEQYQAELQKIEQRLLPFIALCKEHHTAVRIGVNHGSLSDRIMSRYGDTPAGIVESCMEFLRVFRREQFSDVVISIKASNTVVMVESVRLLVAAMDREQMHYPLHLGVTEAGEGEDGRIKSAVGIGALLTEGIGDTIRVSLSEDPECEIPVARQLVAMVEECARLREQAEQTIANDTITLDLEADSYEQLQLKAAMTAGALLIDGKARQLVIRSSLLTREQAVSLADAILQAARVKFTKTEYISCPGCGRTLYNLQDTIHRIKAATSHLKGLKIGIMGCIVNGPGEMADADFGYVGAGRGRISLYKKKVCVEKNIPEAEAVDHLLRLIERSMPTLFIDADDTLWDCQSHFERVMQHLYEQLEPWTGSREEAARELFATERKNMPQLGFGVKAFTLSVIETALRVSGGQLSGSQLSALLQESYRLLSFPCTPLPGVEPTLALLKQRGHRLVLFTKGELQDQENKLQRSGLAQYFDVVEIVSDKTEREFRQLCDKLQLQPQQVVMVGNSLRSDIAPALAVGCRAVHVPFHVTWELEHTEPITHPDLIEISSFEQLPDVL